MKKITILLIFHLCIYMSNGAIFDGWVSDEQDIQIGGENFTIQSSDNTALVLESNNSERRKVVVNLNEPIVQQGYSYLFTDIKNDLDEYLEKHNLTNIHSSTTGNFTYRLIIEKPSPDISISRTTSEQEIAIKDKFNISIVISNSGEESVIGTYQEELPSFLKKIGSLTYELNDRTYEYDSPGQSIEWKGALKEHGSINLLQEVELVGITNTKILKLEKGILKYTFLGETYKEELEIKELEYVIPLLIELDIDQHHITVGEEQAVSLTVTNQRTQHFDIGQLKIEFNENSVLYDDNYENLAYKNNAFIWTGKVKEVPKEFTFSLKPIHTGNTTINIIVNATYRGWKEVIVEDYLFTADLTHPEIKIQVPKSVDSNSDLEISFGIKNDGEYAYKDISANITSNLFDDTRYLFVSLSPGNFVSKSDAYKIPWFDKSTRKNVDFSYAYTSIFNETFYGTINKSITVNKIEFDPLLSITLENYYWNYTNESKYINLTAVFRIKTNDSISKPVVQLQFKEDYDTLNPTIANLSGNGTLFTKRISLPKNTRDLSVNISARYELDNEKYFFSDKILLKTPRVAVVHNKATSIINKSNSLIYAKPNEGGIRIDYSQLSANQIITVALVLLTIFFIIILAVLIPRKKKKGYAKPLSNFSPEDTERIVDRPVEKIEFKINQDSVTDAAPTPSSNLDLLSQYIETCKSQGMTPDKIKSHLVAKGWLEDVIEVYLR